jgi:hypothetical protein
MTKKCSKRKINTKRRKKQVTKEPKNGEDKEKKE